MADVFISYSGRDEELANFVKTELGRHGVTAFAACADLRPGDHWSSTVRANLASSNWVVVLASRAAAASAYVNQEVGGALASGKALVPIVWDMEPSDLPGWLKSYQAVDLRGKTIEDLPVEVGRIAARIQEQNKKAALVIGAVILGLLFLGAREG